jgi:hypothetical protein
MFDNGINFNWVVDEEDQRRLQDLWKAALREDKEKGGQKKNLAAFKKAYQEIREKQIVSRKAAFYESHSKIEKTLGAFGNLIDLG